MIKDIKTFGDKALIEYTKRLPERIGELNFHLLEVRRNVPTKYSIPELIEIKIIFKGF